MKKLGLYEISVLLFFLILPFTAFALEYFCARTGKATYILLKWNVFTMVGLRLCSAGVKQILTPNFTAKEIFEINDCRAFPIVREIGFANIAIGFIGILSLFVETYRIPAAIAGGVYLGMAGCTHLFNDNREKSERFPMITDLWAFGVLTVCILTNLF